MDIKNISSIDMSSLSTEQAYELGLNSIFLEDDGTYNWIYCMKMRQDLRLCHVCINGHYNTPYDTWLR